MSGSNTLSLPSMHSNWDEGVLPAFPSSDFFRPSIRLSIALLNHLSAFSEYGTLELDGRRWSSMTPNWSKRWSFD